MRGILHTLKNVAAPSIPSHPPGIMRQKEKTPPTSG
jgi:hypothetical protein